MDDNITWTTKFLESIVPRGDPLILREPLEEDEARWFRAAVERTTVAFQPCSPGCGRLQRWKESGPDEFLTPKGQQRHLFSLSRTGGCILNRECLAHIGAVARLLLEYGYDRNRYSFSLYRSFTRDLIHKKKGGSYETDAEFYDENGGLWLHVEVKKDRKQVEAITAAIEGSGFESSTVVKELEYVLDLSPKYLWIVGPGSLDTNPFVYRVETHGKSADFMRIADIPDPPHVSGG